MAAKNSKNLWGLSKTSLVAQAGKKKPDAKRRRSYVRVSADAKAAPPKEWKAFFYESDTPSVLRTADTAEALYILVSPLAADEIEVDDRLKTAPLTRVRDAMGTLLLTLERNEIGLAEIDFHLNEAQLAAALLGLEIASYRFKRVLKGEEGKVALQLKQRGRTLSPSSIEKHTQLGQAVNLARHLVNVPPNLLNPDTYAAFVKELFVGVRGARVEVWDEKRLKQENMNLHLAVGQGSKTPSKLVRIKISGGKGAPIALVGKGITFDSGGLDIKPSSGMRLMKKDMGGSAAVVGTAYWAAVSRAKLNLECYLAMAENSVGSESFRPSDVIVARNGQSVEIHNTDAEGRLVLADAMDVAVTQKEKPKTLIDVATLTGAIKVALGSGLAGLFANDIKLSQKLWTSGQASGDPMWPMPLYRKYNAQMNTVFADFVNAVDGFGGAVTAALFLERFAKDVPWAHLDIYAWKDGAEGAWCEAGGSGQGVLALANWLR